jgi:hypothetical protein
MHPDYVFVIVSETGVLVEQGKYYETSKDAADAMRKRYPSLSKRGIMRVLRMHRSQLTRSDGLLY